MTIDPHDPSYVDEADVRRELTDVFARCADGTSRPSLEALVPSLFSLLDRYDGDAGRFTPAEQDAVVDECFPARWCIASCAEASPADPSIDVPRSMLRANAMRLARGHVPVRARALVRLLARGDGADITRGPRRIIGSNAGLTSSRAMPQAPPRRFSEWFARRRPPQIGHVAHPVTLFATGPIEWLAPRIGADVVAVLERHGVACSLASGHASGVALLEAGAVGRFTRVAERTIADLIADVRAGRDIVIPDPAALRAVRDDYPRYVSESMRADALVVAEHAHGPVEYLLALRAAGDAATDAGFDAQRASAGDGVVYHRSLFERRAGAASGAELLAQAGVDVEVIDGCPSVDSMWGLRPVYDGTVARLGARVAGRIGRHDERSLSGESYFGNAVIAAHTGHAPRHPFSILTSGYGIAELH